MKPFQLILTVLLTLSAVVSTAAHAEHMRRADPALQVYLLAGGTLEDLCGTLGAGYMPEECPACLLGTGLPVGATPPQTRAAPGLIVDAPGAPQVCAYSATHLTPFGRAPPVGQT